MDSYAFNETLQQLCSRLLEAFPESVELKNAQASITAVISVSPEIPSKRFAEDMAPFKASFISRDYSFMDGPHSPVHFLGMYEAWICMHDVTKSAVMEYIVKLAGFSGMFDVCDQECVTTRAVDNSRGMVPPNPLNPVMMTNLFNLARDATMHMSDVDAMELLDGRNSQKLGELCFSIIDSLKQC